MDTEPLEQTPASQNPQSQATKAGKGLGASKILSIVLAVMLVASLGLSAWYWQMAEAEKQRLLDEKAQLQMQLDALKAMHDDEQGNDQAGGTSEQANCVDTQDLRANIKDALDSKNTAAFATYTLDPVNYVLAASEYGGDVSAAEAATSLEYTHSATGPWDFNLPAATIDAWKAGFYADHFDDETRYIGRAASGMVVSFDFACNGKIQQIFVAASEDLL